MQTNLCGNNRGGNIGRVVKSRLLSDSVDKADLSSNSGGLIPDSVPVVAVALH
jgi:hypothetical protein